MNLIAAFFTAAIYVGLRSYQQLNVVHLNYKLVPPISMAMAAADYFLIHTIVSSTPIVVIACGLGGAAGCMISMYVESKVNKKPRT